VKRNHKAGQNPPRVVALTEEEDEKESQVLNQQVVVVVASDTVECSRAEFCHTVQLPIFKFIIWHCCDSMLVGRGQRFSLFCFSTVFLFNCKLMVFENEVLGRIFGPKRDSATGEWRRLHNEALCGLYSSPNVIHVMSLRRMRWVGHVAHMSTGEVYTGF